MQRNHFAFAGQSPRLGVLDAIFLGPIGHWKRIVSQHSHSETAQDLRSHPANFSGAENPGGLAMKIKPNQTVERKIQVMNAIACAWNFAIKREKQSDRMLRD